LSLYLFIINFTYFCPAKGNFISLSWPKFGLQTLVLVGTFFQPIISLVTGENSNLPFGPQFTECQLGDDFTLGPSHGLVWLEGREHWWAP